MPLVDATAFLMGEEEIVTASPSSSCLFAFDKHGDYKYTLAYIEGMGGESLCKLAADSLGRYYVTVPGKGSILADIKRYDIQCISLLIINLGLHSLPEQISYLPGKNFYGPLFCYEENIYATNTQTKVYVKKEDTIRYRNGLDNYLLLVPRGLEIPAGRSRTCRSSAAHSRHNQLRSDSHSCCPRSKYPALGGLYMRRKTLISIIIAISFIAAGCSGPRSDSPYYEEVKECHSCCPRSKYPALCIRSQPGSLHRPPSIRPPHIPGHT